MGKKTKESVILKDIKRIPRLVEYTIKELQEAGYSDERIELILLTLYEKQKRKRRNDMLSVLTIDGINRYVTYNIKKVVR